MELQLEDLEAAATEDELAAENAAARTQTVQSFQRKRPSRKPFPDHLPRERVVIAAPDSCPCCGSAKLSKLGEDIDPGENKPVRHTVGINGQAQRRRSAGLAGRCARSNR